MTRLPTMSAMGNWRFFLVLGLVGCWHLPADAQFGEKSHAILLGAMPEKPFKIGVGIRIFQIVSINQKSENFEVVAGLRLEWDDPRLAFDEREHGRPFKVFTREAFTNFVDENAIFSPGFIIYNQQGRRFTQEAMVLVSRDGHAVYAERFTVKLQAPEFDFVQYPFDTQGFFLHVQALYPVGFMEFVPLDGFSRLGDQLGEEEWVFSQTWTSIENVEGVSGQPTSRFSFAFDAHRHLNYYLLRIFVPLGIIIMVSWLTFFLQDFGKRVDIAGANLLIFVAFNFTISSDLPRLGYITFMDAIVVATFVFSGLVVIVNVIFRRMEVTGRESLARRIDNFTIWIYPVTLAALVMYCWYAFVVLKSHF